jgi:hypothetical protein
MTLPQHLGGHLNRTHTDQGILEYFRDHHAVRSLLDVGCGPGGQVLLAQQLGLEAHGIDGDDQVSRPPGPWHIHDYTQGVSALDLQVDLVWSCEFVEHVYEQFVDNFLRDFDRGQWICMCYAPPGYPGHHHVNCQTHDYWIQRIESRGYRFRDDITAAVRRASTMRKKFMRKRALVFEKLHR